MAESSENNNATLVQIEAADAVEIELDLLRLLTRSKISVDCNNENLEIV